ncbi:MAG: DUF1189 family protein [Elusimicrobia bacterium]|nr:DUF1189 family protein [Elusimicrobiota bacterium]
MSIFREPIDCLYRFETYPARTESSGLRTIAYAALLAAVVAACSTVALYLQIAPTIRQAIDWAGRTIPEVSLEDGVATTAAAEPLTLTPPSDVGGAIRIDTARTEPPTHAEMAKEGWVVCLTKHAAYVKMHERLDEYRYSHVRGKHVVRLDASFFRSIGRLASFTVYPGFFLFTCVMYTLWALAAGFLYSVIGIVLSAVSGKGLSYEVLYKLAVFAQTPVMVLQAVLAFAPVSLAPVRALAVASLLVGAYIGLAIRHYPDPAQQPESDSDDDQP